MCSWAWDRENATGEAIPEALDWYVVRERTLPHGSVSAYAIVEEGIVYVRFGVRDRDALNRVHCGCVALLGKEMRAKLHHILEYTTSPGFTLGHCHGTCPEC